MFPEIMGIIGALLGTILGWLLNSFSQRGKLNIYSEWTDRFTHNVMGSMVQSTNWDQAILYSYNLVLDLYNSSGEPKIMRKIEVAFYQDKVELFRQTPKDDSTGINSGPLRFFNDVIPITIPAKTVFTLKLHNGLWKNDDDLFPKVRCITRIYLTYRDDKNKEKRILIKKDYFNQYFERHPVNDEGN